MPKSGADLLQNSDRVADPNDERLAKRREILAQFRCRLGEDAILPGRSVLLPPELGLDDPKRQDGTARGGLGERGVVGHAQVALEPDDVELPKTHAS